MASSILALRRMPAVSTKRIGPSSVSTTVSTVSRVVPGMSCTTARSSPMSRLNSVRLADVGSTRRGHGEKTRSADGGARRRPRRRPRRSRRSGRQPRRGASSRSPVPRPCRALTGERVAEAERRGTPRSALAVGVVDLVGDEQHRLPARRSTSATRLSSSVTPTMASTTKSTASASRDGLLALAADLGVEASPPGSQPPVSTSRKGTPCHSASTSLRSRVTPGFSSTIATRGRRCG